MDALRRQYLDAIGITLWRRRALGEDLEVASPPSPASRERSSSEPAASDSVHEMGWDALERAVAGCTACALHATRTQTVFGVGDRGARWMIVGEAPGADEDRQGEPFVGRAGRLLDAMLRAAGLQRAEVFIANVLKCRPPNNRDPLPEEATCCTPFLHRQIELVSPSVILAVGRIAAQHLLASDQPLARLRGRRHRYADTEIPLVVTYHPAYLLRSPSQKSRAWEDLKLARACAESPA